MKIYIEKEQLKIHYDDNGKGLNEEARKKIFEPFYTTGRSSGGTGLGLYTTYNVVTQKFLGEINVTT
jgi:signal transduction histidine kinase